MRACAGFDRFPGEIPREFLGEVAVTESTCDANHAKGQPEEAASRDPAPLLVNRPGAAAPSARADMQNEVKLALDLSCANRSKASSAL